MALIDTGLDWMKRFGRVERKSVGATKEGMRHGESENNERTLSPG